MPRFTPPPPALARGTGSFGSFLTLAVVACSFVITAATGADHTTHSTLAMQQERLLSRIEQDFLATAHYTGVRRMSTEVAAAMRAVPRHHYVNRSDQARAYANHPLSIGHGQTISQPFIVALMTELASLTPAARVLEIGTGSGYQAAVLAQIAAAVYSIEIIPQLAARARERLDQQDYPNIHLRVGDGNAGWPEAAPFDAVVVTAAGPVPSALVDQLAPGGRLVMPVGEAPGEQILTVISRAADGTLSRQPLLPVRFVPLVSGQTR